MPNAAPYSKHVLIIAGDPSADRHGAVLVEELKHRCPEVRISALGGSFLQAQADRFLFPLVGVGGFGFLEPLFKLPQLWKAHQAVKTVLKDDKPDLVIPMDYYGFNIRAASLAHHAGIPVIYYISPQVWASRPGRVRKLAKVIQKMLVIFPFEKPLYQRAGVPVAFVGHPLLRHMPAPKEPSPLTTIGLLPGSRMATVQRHLPLLVDTARRLLKTDPALSFVLFRPGELPQALYNQAVGDLKAIRVVAESDFSERSRLSFAISVSGTAALENMLLGVPMIIMYRLSAFTYRMAKRLIRIPFIGIPNILAGRVVVPERIQDEATPENLAAAASVWLRDPAELHRVRAELLQLRETLDEKNATPVVDEILNALT